MFHFSGFAAASDVLGKEWGARFAFLERRQDGFAERQAEFRSPAYRWPKDPLRTWSRVWEYVYAYEHIRELKQANDGRRLKVVDYGSGVTFFPFAVADLDFEVTCVDIDPICIGDLQRAGACGIAAAGEVQAVLVNSGGVPLETASQDIVYCISVLEHIEKFENTIDEMARILRPGGHLVLTVDIDLRGGLELGVREFARLRQALGRAFVLRYAERPVHPLDLLTTATSPYHSRSTSPWFLSRQLLKAVRDREWPRGDVRVGVLLGVYGTVLVRRD